VLKVGKTLLNLGNHANSAYVNSNDKEVAYFQTMGYYEAARELIKASLDKNNTSSLIHPIMYCSRHFIEILFKYNIDYINEYSYLKGKYKPTHDVLDNLSILSDYIRELMPENPIPDNIKDNITQIINLDLDSNSTRFKYNVIKNKKTKRTEISFVKGLEIDLSILDEMLEEIYSLTYIKDMLQKKWDKLFKEQNNL
jgi:hypothetical protein